MSEYDNVVAGKLKLKGKALHVKAGGVAKKKKQKKHYEQLFSGEYSLTDHMKEMHNEINADDGNDVASKYEERLTPAERQYRERWKQLEAKRLLKNASESHRDRIQKFNQYLANLSEHCDIPKVGPGYWTALKEKPSSASGFVFWSFVTETFNPDCMTRKLDSTKNAAN